MRKRMHHTAKSDLFGYAKILRENMTESEMILWNKLKDKQLDGYKFRRQHPVHVYILDFYCHAAKLSVEIDGDYHLEKYQKWYDSDRTEFLTEIGITELRFTNNQVLNEIDYVLNTIKSNIHKYIKNEKTNLFD